MRFGSLLTGLVLAGAILPLGVSAQDIGAIDQNNLARVPSVAADFYFQGGNYDPAIPTPLQVLGRNIGEAMTPHAGIVSYFTALAAAAPDRMKLFDYGQSWQGRKLIYAAIGSREKIANLDAIRADAQRLADPRSLSASEAEAIIARHPAIVWLAYTVHGDETGPSDAGLQLAYHLLAARGDARTDEIRRNTLVIIVPVQNPDGRDRFISGNLASTGLSPDPDPLAAERDQQWPGGRVNHAIIDLNRDWFALTQPETRAHTTAVLKWFPSVMVDSHEMGTDQSFFFPPEANPINPNVPQTQRNLRAIIGQNNARRFDEAGIPYFTREVYDLFYPGYGDGWPSSHGAISMTYEQGSSRGMQARRTNGTVFTFADTVRSQFIASLSTLEVAARERERFVRAFYDFRRTAIAEGRTEATKAYVIPAQTDQASADKLAANLSAQGIEVTRARAGFNACGKSFGVGSYVVSAAQPAKRLIRNLLEREISLDPAFIAEQERRRREGLDDEIYDVTAWSLPLLYNVSVETCATDPAITGERVGPEVIRPGTLTNPEARVAFVVPSGSVATTRFMATAVNAGLFVRSVEEAFTLDGRTFPAGSLVVNRSENGPNVTRILADAARVTGANITGFDTSWVTSGPSLGSGKAIKLRAPRIALAWDQPVDRYSAGATRYTLERKFGVRVTPIRIRRLASAALGGFDVVIIPDSEGDYGSSLGEAGARNLKAFARNGGVVIGLGGGTSWMADPRNDVTSLRRETATVSEEEAKARVPAAKPKDGEATVDGINIADATSYNAAISEAKRDPTPLDGAIVRGETLQSHWLTAGLAPQLHMMLQGSDIYRPLTRDQGENVVRFSAPNDVTASGIVWSQSRQQLAFKPVVAVEPIGRGYVVAFTIDPTYRGQADGLDALLMNAIYQTTARARPSR